MKKLKKVILIVVLIAIVAIGIMIMINTNSVSNTNITDTEETKIEAEKVIEIKENMFITLLNDVYINQKRYIGKTMKIEGFVTIDEFAGKTSYWVVRNTPGCCGNDGMAGIEFYYDDEDMPKENEWVQVVGTIELSKKMEGDEYPVLKATDLIIKEERGAEFVSN